jgi:membrane fusion protein (multidrug efflux system)
MLIPQRAVLQGPKGSIVYVVNADNKVEIRDVKATVWKGNQWLVEEGLASGEQVVVDSLQRVIPDSTVKPVPVEVEKPGSPAPEPQKTEASK